MMVAQWTLATLSLLLPGQLPHHGPHLRAGRISASSPADTSWMNRLGRATASKKKWANPQPNDSLGPGSFALAADGSFDHYFLESIVLILEHGAEGTRGVLLNHETPWVVDDMTPEGLGPFGENKLFLGGDAGRDTMIMIHGESELPGAREVGRGIYQGGVSAAIEAVERAALPAYRFKFFYKTIEWLPGALEHELSEGTFELAELSPALWLTPGGPRGPMWSEVRQLMWPDGHPDADAKRERVAQTATSAAEANERAKQKRAEERAAAEAEEAAAEEQEAELSEERRRMNDRLALEAAEEAFAEAEARKLAVAKAAEAASKAGGAGGPAAASKAKTMTEADEVEARAWLAEQGIFPPASKESREDPTQDQAAGEDATTPTGAATSSTPPSAPSVKQAAAGAPAAESGSASAISAVLDFRVHLGSEQWLVRWAGCGDEENTWEAWRELDTAELRERAESLREQHDA